MVKQVVVMAGGMGTRLRPLTYDIPKPMVPVKDKPFLEHLVLLLKNNGFSDFLFCTGYLSKHIEQYFLDGSKWGINIQYSVELSASGTGGALKLAEPLLKDKFLLLNGDTLLDINYRDLVESFDKDSSEAYIVAYTNEDNITANNIRVDKDNWVIEYDKKYPENKTCVDAGVQIFRKSILDKIPAQRVVSLEEEIFPVLIKKHQLKAYMTNKRFFDMGTPERLFIIEKVLS